MGIMDIIKSPSFIKGAVKEGISIYDKAEEVGQEGLENLKIARKEVAKTVGDLTDKYNMAQAVGDRVGGGAFAKYLFKTKSIDYLSSLNDSTEESFGTEMMALKANFNNLSKEDKESLDEFSVSDKYDADVADAKVKGNLVATNNIGESTGKLTLADRMTSGVRAGFDTREKDIIDSVGGGTLRDPSPIEGGFESISSGKGEIPYLLAGEYGIEYQKLKNDAEKGFADYLKSNKFKVDGTNMYLSSQKINEVGNLIFPEGVRDGNNVRGLSSQEVIQNVNTISELSGISPDMVIEDILKQKYLDRTYGGTFKYLGVLEMIDKMDKAAEAYEG